MRSRFTCTCALLALTLMAASAIAAPIHDAAGKGEVSKVAALLKKNPKLLNLRDKDQATPLHYAVASGKTEVIKLLLAKNAQVNLKRSDGATPLHLAVAMGRKDVVDLLVKKGAKADLTNIVVAFPKGAVVTRNGKKLAGTRTGTVLKVADVISGGAKGNLDLIVGSVATVRVKPGTRIRIQNVEKTRGGADVRIRLGKGTLLTRLKALTGQSRFILETPGVVAAARGTAYLVRYANNRTDVLVAEGKVAVSLLKTPAREVSVGASQKVSVTKELPAAPTAVAVSDAGTVKELLSVKPPQDPALVGWSVTLLQPAGATASEVLGVYGDTQVGYAYINGMIHACLWKGTAGTWVDLHPTGAKSSQCCAVYGDVQVGAVEPTTLSDGPFTSRAARWRGSPQGWVDLTPPGYVYSLAAGISEDTIVGVAGLTTPTRAVRLTGPAASWFDLSPSGEWSAAAGVYGSSVVGAVTYRGPKSHAALWRGDSASWIDLNPAGADTLEKDYESRATAVYGETQVGYASFGGFVHAGLWKGTPESWLDLHPAGAQRSEIWGVYGDIQVGDAAFGGGSHAGIWRGSAGSWFDLHPLLPPGYVASACAGVWSSGAEIWTVGYASKVPLPKNDQIEAVMWHYRPPR